MYVLCDVMRLELMCLVWSETWLGWLVVHWHEIM